MPIVDPRGAVLRSRSGPIDTETLEDFEWPESGPSGSSKAKGLADDEVPSGNSPVGHFGSKAIAAMTGALTTSLLMTPFDVLKTRLQTVRPHPNLSSRARPEIIAEQCCQNSVSLANISPRSTAGVASSVAHQLPSTSTSRFSAGPSSVSAPPSGCLHPSKWAGIWGETVVLEDAVCRTATVVGPRGQLMVLPMEYGETAVSGFWSEIAAVRRETGVRGLWKGVGTTITMAIPSSAIYMLGYEYLLSRISPYFANSSPSMLGQLPRQTPTSSKSTTLTPAPLLAGSLARAVSASVISPIEMFKTRLQALPTQKGSPTYASTMAEMGGLVRDKGPTILWRGLGPTLWRDVPFSGIYWAGFEIIKAELTSEDSRLPPLSPIATSFTSGAISGTIAALCTQPFDVLKTRRQVFTPSPDCSPAALHHRASTLPIALHVIKTEGWGALFAGTVPRCGKVAPACGVMIACYEGVGRYLQGK